MIFVPFPDNDITDEEKKLYIREIQELLRSMEIARNGYSDIPVDGIFGQKTDEAVKAFQKAHGLAPTGVVDRVTFYRIRAAPNTGIYGGHCRSREHPANRLGVCADGRYQSADLERDHRHVQRFADGFGMKVK